MALLWSRASTSRYPAAAQEISSRFCLDSRLANCTYSAYYLNTPLAHSLFNRVIIKQLKNIDNKLQSQFAIAIELAFCGFAATVNMSLSMFLCMYVLFCVCLCCLRVSCDMSLAEAAIKSLTINADVAVGSTVFQKTSCLYFYLMLFFFLFFLLLFSL